MPVPDAIPPEIWFHIASVAENIVLNRSEFIPWLQVSPQTCAKGMHDAAFAVLFRDLHIEAHSDEAWLESSSRLSRYARETQLCTAVRNIHISWDIIGPLDDDSEWETQILGRENRRKRNEMLKIMEQLVLYVFQKFPGLRALDWSNSCVSMSPLPMDYGLYRRMDFSSLKNLRFMNCEFPFPLDLRSAISLSTLHLINVTLTSLAPFPAILLTANLRVLLLFDVDVGTTQTQPQDGSLTEADILASLDLSQISLLQLCDENSFTPNDLKHIFPVVPSPRSVGERLNTLRVFHVDSHMIKLLSRCPSFPVLRELRLDLNAYEVVSVTNADQAMKHIFSFVGRQKSLENLGVSLAEMDVLPDEEFQGKHSNAFGDALTQPYVRDALAGLEQLHSLLLGAYTFRPQFPLLCAQFVLNLPALKSFVIKCVDTTTLTKDILDILCQYINRYPNLSSFALFPEMSDEDDAETENMEELFVNALVWNAPRIEYFTLGEKGFRLKTGVEVISLPNPNPQDVPITELDPFA